MKYNNKNLVSQAQGVPEKN